MPIDKHDLLDALLLAKARMAEWDDDKHDDIGSLEGLANQLRVSSRALELCRSVLFNSRAHCSVVSRWGEAVATLEALIQVAE